MNELYMEVCDCFMFVYVCMFLHHTPVGLHRRRTYLHHLQDDENPFEGPWKVFLLVLEDKENGFEVMLEGPWVVREKHFPKASKDIKRTLRVRGVRFS